MKTKEIVNKIFKEMNEGKQETAVTFNMKTFGMKIAQEIRQQTRKDTLKEVYNYLKEDMRLSQSAYLDTELRLSVFIKDVRDWFKKEAQNETH
jgi:hypothetical protein